MPSLSHPAKNPSTVAFTGLSGPDAFRAYFFPRQVLRLNETAQCLGLSYAHFFRRHQAGTLDLKIRKNEIGERYVLLSDLISYLFPEEGSNSKPAPPTKKAKRGRPRKTVTSDGRKGGAR